MIKNFINRLINSVLPETCVICGTAVAVKEAADTGGLLCGKCLKELERQRLSGITCPGCGVPLISEKNLCTVCREIEVTTPCRGIFMYRGAARILIQRYKFVGEKSIAAFFAAETAAVLKSRVPGALVVPVPSGSVSRKRNGWGHMETIAELLPQMGVPVCTWLLKRTNMGQQKGLGREERKASGRRFRVKKAVPTQEIVLLDDVRTTGATLAGARAALTEKGFKVSSYLVLAID